MTLRDLAFYALGFATLPGTFVAYVLAWHGGRKALKSARRTYRETLDHIGRKRALKLAWKEFLRAFGQALHDYRNGVQEG